nr:DUF2807 domain-containing protein [uncultured Psychroserpens sp.]
MKSIRLNSLLVMISCLMSTMSIIAQNNEVVLKSFDKIIISPHIQVTFQEGEKESIVIEENTESPEKFHIEVNDKTLHLYLEGAKISSPTEKVKKDGYKQKIPLYKGTIVKAIVTYKKVKTFALRGEQRFDFISPIWQDEMQLRIYGESQVYMNKVKLKSFKVEIYGESFLEIEAGEIDKQKFTAYGESKINMLAVNNKETKLTAYGDVSFRLNVSNKLKVTSYGEATIAYKGDAKLSKGLVIGETEIVKM